jgi:hypothetical protein
MGANLIRGITTQTNSFERSLRTLFTRRAVQAPKKRFTELKSSLDGSVLYCPRTNTIVLDKINFPVYGRTVESSFWSYNIKRECFLGFTIHPLLWGKISLPKKYKGWLTFEHQIHHLQSDPTKAGLTDLISFESHKPAISITGKCLITTDEWSRLKGQIYPLTNIQKAAYKLSTYHETCENIVNIKLKEAYGNRSSIISYLKHNKLLLRCDNFIYGTKFSVSAQLAYIFLAALKLFCDDGPKNRKLIKGYIPYFVAGGLVPILNFYIGDLNPLFPASVKIMAGLNALASNHPMPKILSGATAVKPVL